MTEAAGNTAPGTLKRTLAITNKRGLHARAAAKFVRTAGQFDAAIRVSFKGQDVSGLSIMGLMMLAAGIGSSIELSCSGRQAFEAMSRVVGPGRRQVRRGLKAQAQAESVWIFRSCRAAGSAALQSRSWDATIRRKSGSGEPRSQQMSASRVVRPHKALSISA